MPCGRKNVAPSKAPAPQPARESRPQATNARPKPAKLGYLAARELEEVPAKIESLEIGHRELVELLSQPAFYQSDAAEQARVHSRVAALASELEAAYARWDELETLRDGG